MHEAVDALPVCRGQRIPDTRDAVTGDDADQASGAVLYVNYAFQIAANQFLETELEKLRASVWTGYARGKLPPRDRRDWFD